MTYPKYINELCQVTYDMWNKGWDEYNGGNISYRLTKEEASAVELLTLITQKIEKKWKFLMYLSTYKESIS